MRTVVVTFGLLSLAGCASIFSSGPTALSFGSDPDGAQVVVNGERMGTTPVTLELHANHQHTVTFHKEGCEATTVILQTHTQAGWVVLDIFAGIIGVAVDAATGEWREFNDKTPYATLRCQQTLPVAEVPRAEEPARPRAAVPQPAPPEAQVPGDRADRTAPMGYFVAGEWTTTIRQPGVPPYPMTLVIDSEQNVGRAIGRAIYEAETPCTYTVILEYVGGNDMVLAQELVGGPCETGTRIVLRRSGDQLSGEWLRSDDVSWFSGVLDRSN